MTQKVSVIVSDTPIRRIAQPVPTFSEETPVEEIQQALGRDRPLDAVVITRRERPVGLVMSIHLNRMLSRRYGVALYSKKPVKVLMDGEPLILPPNATLDDAARKAMAREKDKVYDHILVGNPDRLEGIVSVKCLLETLAAAHQQRAADLHRSIARLETEINGRTRAEQALRRSEQMHRSIFENTGTAMAIIEQDMTISMANARFAQLTGRDRKTAGTGIKTLDFFPADQVDRIAGYHHRRRKRTDSAPDEYESRILDRDGEAHDVIIKVGVIPETGQSVASFTDISERKEAEHKQRQLQQRLQQSQKMEAIGTLAGGIAHDFNNILVPIMGYAEMLLADASPGSGDSKALENIVLSARRARDLTTQILTFSRQNEKNIQPMKVPPIIKEGLKLLRATLPTTIRILTNLDPSCPEILADPTEIHQIVMNLATNAYHAMQKGGGELRVRLSKWVLEKGEPGGAAPGSYVRLEIADTGTGIDPTILSRIFDPYFTTKGPGKGTGMGLSIVHGIVKSYKGSISVESTPGHGTRFILLFPAAETFDADMASSGTAPLPAGNREHILVVDDEVCVLDIHTQFLQTLGYRTTARSRPAEALEELRRNPHQYQLILTDKTMPGMTGLELAEEAACLVPRIPVILATGFSDLSTEAHARSLGICRVLRKPVPLHVMADAVHTAMTAPRPVA
jgi:PAS domain S-box-containing protein